METNAAYALVTIKVQTHDEDGCQYNHPATWDWTELVGPGTEYVSLVVAE